MGKLNVLVVEEAEHKEIYGLSMRTTDKNQSLDISVLHTRYKDIVREESFPLYIVSRNYKPETTEFELFIGGNIKNDGFETMLIPKGTYGKVTVKPLLSFIWGPRIGKARRKFYIDWLPESGFTARNMEFEVHTEKSISKKPEIELMFAIEK